MKLNIKLTNLELSVEGDMDPAFLKQISAPALWDSLIRMAGEKRNEPEKVAESHPLKPKAPSFSKDMVGQLLTQVLRLAGEEKCFPVVNLGGSWAVSRNGGNAPYWCDRAEAEHDIKCIITNRDGSSVVVVDVPELGFDVTAHEILDKEDFELLFGSGSWNESLS